MPVPSNVTPSSTNTFGSTSPIHQLIITPGPAQIGSIPPMCQETITSHLVNALGSIAPIRQLTIIPGPAQISSILSPDWPLQVFNSYTNPYT